MFGFGFGFRNRDEDEGIPSENEEEKRMLDTKARELKGKAARSIWDLVRGASTGAGTTSGPSAPELSQQPLQNREVNGF